MNLPAFALKRTTLTNFLATLLAIGGVFSYFQLGRLEDPDFTVKRAVIVTAYPGASPTEVELEVTDRIEKAIQEMPQLKELYSLSRAGLSIIRVDMKEEYWADRLPQVWDEMRRKINDVEKEFPPGVISPDIGDDFSFVYGFVLAMTGAGYTYAVPEEDATAVRKEHNATPGVARPRARGGRGGERHIRVNCGGPGLVGTPLVQRGRAASPESGQPDLRPMLHPEDVAEAVVRLINNDGVTGLAMQVRAGQPMRLM